MGEITDRQMAVKPSTKDIWLNESAPKGHGRFIARITPSGDRLFYFRYTDSDGKRIRLPLGAYDRDGTTGLTLKAARKKANELSVLYQSGIINLRESLEAEENARIAIRDAELARIAKEKADAEAEAKRLNERQTVRALFERWI
ncbi:MAG TPA: Arm DNA-binding domain-containing protein, partial [Agitococcus sp.]|nr:Arm DNA-binding domain-containing protein [Agitococcus sp.]